MKKLFILAILVIVACSCERDMMRVNKASASRYTTDFDMFIPKAIKSTEKYLVIDKFQLSKTMPTDIGTWKSFRHDIDVPIYYYVLRVNKEENINGCTDVYVPMDFYERFNIGDTINL